MHLSAASTAPFVGVFLSFVRTFVPVWEVYGARKERRLGELNPMPYAAMILNHTGWIVYAVLRNDWFIFVADAPGLLCGVWITFSLLPLASLKMQDRLHGLVLLAATLWCLLAMVTMIISSKSAHATILLWGWTVSVTQVVLFASPLSTLYQAVKQRSSASFHLGLSIMSFISSLMWTIYGLTSKNLFLLVPNLLGVLLSIAALGVCVFLPRPTPDQTAAAQQQDRIRAVELAVEM
ncbi:hypothetical protein WJX72_009611 [[Myrmecia] bisecta]|uniref:Bidirectional sugar transporter SWEET n=1 Tax=[Myrmecia] bisecta TaxID=41462 RepID=A0AAW1P7S1_9CHLO